MRFIREPSPPARARTIMEFAAPRDLICMIITILLCSQKVSNTSRAGFRDGKVESSEIADDRRSDQQLA